MNYQEPYSETIDDRIDALPASLSTIHERVAEEFHCHHPSTKLFVQTCANGTRKWSRRCTTCFEPIGKAWLSHSEVSAIADQALEYDSSLRLEWSNKQCQRRQELRASIERQISELWERKKHDRKDEYGRYLLTDKWRSKRDRVLQRDGFKCQACFLRPATQVHHKTYEHIFDEPLFDLVSVCDTCHDALHKHDHEL